MNWEKEKERMEILEIMKGLAERYRKIVDKEPTSFLANMLLKYGNKYIRNYYNDDYAMSVYHRDKSLEVKNPSPFALFYPYRICVIDKCTGEIVEDITLID